mgnify:CR=1 FL=1
MIAHIAPGHLASEAVARHLGLDHAHHVTVANDQAPLHDEVPVARIRLDGARVGARLAAHVQAPQPPMRYGEGLTSQILEAKQPLLLNREEQFEGIHRVGTRASSYLGVPILAGDQAIGVIEQQRAAGEQEPDRVLHGVGAPNEIVLVHEIEQRDDVG